MDTPKKSTKSGKVGVKWQKKFNYQPEEIYKRTKNLKIIKILAPVCFWGFLLLSIVCLIFAVKNSFGNIAEIMDLTR